jgi:mono/diheme cytochrome c family protein
MKKIAVWTIVIAGIFLFCTSFFQDYDLEKSIGRGKEIYVSNCLYCHLEDGGATTDQCPALAKSDYLMKGADSLITVILKGQAGEVIVNGTKYNQEMLAMNYLNDAEIADVLNYIRNSWGNKMAVITPQQVKTLRK